MKLLKARLCTAIVLLCLITGVAHSSGDAGFSYEADLISAVDKANRWGLDALPDLDRLIVAHPERPEAYGWKGTLLHRVASLTSDDAERKSLLEGARIAFLAAARIAPETLRYQASLASVLLDMHRYDEVINVLEPSLSSIDTVAMQREKESFLRAIGDYVSAAIKLPNPEARGERVRNWTESALTLGMGRDAAIDYLYFLGFVDPQSAAVYYRTHQKRFGYVDVIHSMMCEGMEDGGHGSEARRCYQSLSQEGRARQEWRVHAEDRMKEIPH